MCTPQFMQGMQGQGAQPAGATGTTPSPAVQPNSSQQQFGTSPGTAAGAGSLVTLLGALGNYFGQKQGIAGEKGAVDNQLQQQQGYNQQIQANSAPLFAASPVAPGATAQVQNAMAAQTAGILKGFQSAGGASSVATRAGLLSNQAGADTAAKAGFQLGRSQYDQQVQDVLGRNNQIRDQASLALQPLQAQMAAGGANGLQARTLGAEANVFGPAMIKSSFYQPVAQGRPGQTPTTGLWAGPDRASQSYPTNTNMLGQTQDMAA